MLERIRASGRKTFLLTNSDWWYKAYHDLPLADEDQTNRDNWMSYFDMVLLIPASQGFSTGTPSSRVDSTSKLVHLSACISGPEVYSGDNHHFLHAWSQGPDVMYAGDHLADVIKCRKLCEWRTLLIVPELLHELEVTPEVLDFSQLSKFEAVLADNPDLGELKMRLWDAVNELNKDFGGSGSLSDLGTNCPIMAAKS